MDWNETFNGIINTLQSIITSNIAGVICWAVVFFIIFIVVINIINLIAMKSESQEETKLGGNLEENICKGLNEEENNEKNFINVPQRNVLFSGREDLLNSLFVNSKIQIISQNQTIHGLGGVGKTSIAIEYAYRNKDKYNVILWVNAESFANLSESYMNIALSFGIDTADVKPEPLIMAVNQALFNFDPNERCLIIFDNAKDRQSIEPYIPQGSGHVLITSRSSNWEGIAGVKQIGVFTENEALTFLKKDLKINYDVYAMDIKELAMILGYMPLALAQASAYINKTNKKPSLYIEDFKKKITYIFNKLKPANYPYAVATTWQISIDKLKETNPKSIEFLYQIAFLAPNKINLVWFTTEEEFSDFYFDVIEPLEIYSLVSRQDFFISIHRLVQMVIRDSIAVESVKREQIEEVINIISKSYFFDFNNAETWEYSYSFIPHVEVLMGYIEKFNIESEQVSYILHTTGSCYDAQSQYDKALKFYFKALGMKEKILGNNHPDTAATYYNIGSVYYNLGSYNDALNFYDKAYEIFQNELGSNHQNSIAIKQNIEHLEQIIQKELSQTDKNLYSLR